MSLSLKKQKDSFPGSLKFLPPTVFAAHHRHSSSLRVQGLNSSDITASAHVSFLIAGNMAAMGTSHVVSWVSRVTASSRFCGQWLVYSGLSLFIATDAQGVSSGLALRTKRVAGLICGTFFWLGGKMR